MCVVHECAGNAGFDSEWDIIRRAIKRGNRRIRKGECGVE